MKLLLDIGNTRIKWARVDGDRIGELQAVAHADPDWAQAFAAGIDDGARPSEILLAAVAEETTTAAALQVIAARWPQSRWRRARSSARLGRLVSAYAQPERLGVDRFLSCAAVAAASTQASLLIGCGTALTVDLIGADGMHHGGLIAPAPDTMRAALLSRAAGVHWLQHGMPTDFGTSTEDALEGGVWAAAAGLVERAQRKALQQLGTAPQLIAHGGAAESLALMLETPLRIEPDLVMRGLLLWADQGDDGNDSE